MKPPSPTNNLPNLFEGPASQCLSWTMDIINRFGPRLAGTESCLNTAKSIREEFENICGTARLETFTTHPLAFMNFYKINVTVYIICLILIFYNQPLPAVIGLLFIIVSGMLEFGYYREFFDWLFPQKTCANVWSKLEPQGKVEQQIIISGHHDSPQEILFLKKYQKLFAFRAFAPDLFHIGGIIFCSSWVFIQAFSGRLPTYIGVLKIFMLAGLLVVIPKFFLVGRKVSPGAGDNLIASAMIIQTARMFANQPGTGSSSLKHTRLTFISFDAEESGLRGSRAFVRQHSAELQSFPSFMLNIDTIYNANQLQFMLSDLNGYVKLSQETAQECQQIACKAGYPARLTQMLFGGGSTDAAELAKVGFKATTMIAMPTEIIRDGLVYHTLKDTIDRVEPEAVRACLRVIHDFILQKEQ
ncbi:MAG TPA: M28 family peptidase [Anaerolineaceae bacterium]|nr:M28 family peptidase [Anaerolineaceae bacterium]